MRTTGTRSILHKKPSTETAVISFNGRNVPLASILSMGTAMRLAEIAPAADFAITVRVCAIASMDFSELAANTKQL